MRRAPAEHLGAGVAQEAVALLLGLDQVVPVIAGVEQEHPVAQLEDRLVVDVGGAGLDQQHADVGVLAQPRGEDAAGGPAAGDDVVELAGVDHGAASPMGVSSGSVGTAAACSRSTSIGLRR